MEGEGYPKYRFFSVKRRLCSYKKAHACLTHIRKDLNLPVALLPSRVQRQMQIIKILSNAMIAWFTVRKDDEGSADSDDCEVLPKYAGLCPGCTLHNSDFRVRGRSNLEV